jgi:type IV pilus assembly protein PilO
MANRDEMLTRFAAVPTQQKIVITLLLVVIIGVGYYSAFYLDQEQKIAGLNAEIQNLDKNLLEKQAIANDLPKFRREVERLNQRLKEAVSLLPNTADIPDLLTKVAEQVEKSGLTLKKFELQDEIPRNFYAEVPVEMEVQAAYHELAVFFDKVSKMPRIVNVSNISMDTPEVRTQKVVLKAKFSARTYRFIEQAKPAAAEGAAPAGAPAGQPQ